MMYFVIECETGLMGSSYYSRYEEAQNAADWRTYCTGLKWRVKEVRG